MRERAVNPITTETVHAKHKNRFSTYRLINNIPELIDVKQFLQTARENGWNY